MPHVRAHVAGLDQCERFGRSRQGVVDAQARYPSAGPTRTREARATRGTGANRPPPIAKACRRRHIPPCPNSHARAELQWRSVWQRPRGMLRVFHDLAERMNRIGLQALGLDRRVLSRVRRAIAADESRRSARLQRPDWFQPGDGDGRPGPRDEARRIPAALPQGVLLTDAKRHARRAVFALLNGDYPELAEPTTISRCYAGQRSASTRRASRSGAISRQPEPIDGLRNLGDVYAARTVRRYARARRSIPTTRRSHRRSLSCATAQTFRCATARIERLPCSDPPTVPSASCRQPPPIHVFRPRANARGTVSSCSRWQAVLGAKVKLATTMGDIVIGLDAAKAPKTVDNFVQYVKSGPLRPAIVPPM